MNYSKARIFLFHVIACALFLVVPIFFFNRPPEDGFSLAIKPLQRDLIGNFLMILFFYVNYYFLIPKFYFNRKYLLYALIVFIFFIVICYLPSLLTGRNPFNGEPPVHAPKRFLFFGRRHQPPAEPGQSNFFIDEIRNHIFLFAIVVLFSLLLRIRGRLFQMREEKMAAELSLLKAQINPHFLFNTLNSIYALTVKKDDSAPDAIIHLSELMRYIIKDAQENRIGLEKELQYIHHYVELQKARLRDTAQIKFNHEGDPNGFSIAPLILITYIENAFKYGVNPDEHSAVKIDIKIKDDVIDLRVLNTKVKIASAIQSTGIGIHNTKERLGLLYPRKHELSVEETEHTYAVHLTIKLA